MQSTPDRVTLDAEFIQLDNELARGLAKLDSLHKAGRYKEEHTLRKTLVPKHRRCLELELLLGYADAGDDSEEDD